MKGYENAKIIDDIPRPIVKRLNCIKIKNANKHKIKTYIQAVVLLHDPDAIGLFFVLETFLSIFSSTISLTMQPALLIKTEPRKNNSR